MTHGRFDHCMLLAIYKEMTDKLSLIDVAGNEFCFGSDERSHLFGYFYQNDLHFKVCVFLSYNKHQQSRDFLSKKTMCVTHWKGPSIKYIHKIYRKSNIS